MTTKKRTEQINEAINQMCVDVFQGKKLMQCKKENPSIYKAAFDCLKVLRDKNLSDQPLTDCRCNVYICSQDKEWAVIMAQASAISLYPDLANDECYYVAETRGTRLKEYDGQPVIIWDGYNAARLLKDLGGTSGILSAFAMRPSEARQYVDGSYLPLVNEWNIVIGTEPYEKFFRKLADVTDTNSLHDAEEYRLVCHRFQVVINLYDDDAEMLINKGYAEGSLEYDQYITDTLIDHHGMKTLGTGRHAHIINFEKA